MHKIINNVHIILLVFLTFSFLSASAFRVAAFLSAVSLAFCAAAFAFLAFSSAAFLAFSSDSNRFVLVLVVHVPFFGLGERTLKPSVKLLLIILVS